MDYLRKQKPRTGSGTDGFVSTSGSLNRSPSNRTAPVLPGGAQPVTNLSNFKRRPGFAASTKPLGSSVPSALPQSPAGRQTPSPVGGPRRPPANNMDMKLPGATRPGHKKPKTKRQIVKRILKVLAVLTVLAAILVGFLIFKGFLNVNDVLRGGGNAAALDRNVDPSKLKGEGDGRVNILMLGRGGEGFDGPDLTDTILVASIDPIQKQASLLSIPRDLYVKNGDGGTKINAIYVNAKNRALNNNRERLANKEAAQKAGTDAIKSKVQETMGIPIHYYVMLDFKAFEDAINTVGGVSLNVDKDGEVYERLYDPSTRKQYILSVKAGPNTFDGKRALFYSRSRQTSNRGDFDRAERQRALLIALKEKILSAGTYSNPVKINQLITNFGSHVSSDLATNDLTRLYDIAGSIESSKITSLGLADPPNNFVTNGMAGNQSIVRPIAGLYDYSQIHSFVRNSLKDSFLANEKATVAIYNGTTVEGLASKRAAELKSFGYNVITVDSAPTSNYSVTTLIDRTKGAKRYTKNYLEQRFKLKAIDGLPDASITTTADFVIIIGSNETTQ